MCHRDTETQRVNRSSVISPCLCASVAHSLGALSSLGLRRCAHRGPGRRFGRQAPAALPRLGEYGLNLISVKAALHPTKSSECGGSAWGCERRGKDSSIVLAGVRGSVRTSSVPWPCWLKIAS